MIPIIDSHTHINSYNTKEIPTIASGILNLFAIFIADSTNRSEPNIKRQIPIIIKVIDRKNE